MTNGVGGDFTVPVTSYRERPFSTVVMQQYDYSCGAAVLATIFSHHLGRPTTEVEAFLTMIRLGDAERIRREGFSLLEMKLFVESIGYEADGFRVTLRQMANAAVPLIVLVDLRGYRHFVVVKGVRPGYVMVGDPAAGMRLYTAAEFESIWVGGLVFNIHSADEIAAQHWNMTKEWGLFAPGPIGEAVDRRTLADFTSTLPDFNEFLR